MIHVVAAELHDLTALLARLAENAPPIESLARADAIKRPHDESIDSRARGRRNPPRIAPMTEPPGSAGKRSRRPRPRFSACARSTPRKQATHIGGVIPSRPTDTAAASSVSSSFLFAAAMKIFAPGLSSFLSPGT